MSDEPTPSQLEQTKTLIRAHKRFVTKAVLDAQQAGAPSPTSSAELMGLLKIEGAVSSLEQLERLRRMTIDALGGGDDEGKTPEAPAAATPRRQRRKAANPKRVPAKRRAGAAGKPAR